MSLTSIQVEGLPRAPNAAPASSHGGTPQKLKHGEHGRDTESTERSLALEVPRPGVLGQQHTYRVRAQLRISSGTSIKPRWRSATAGNTESTETTRRTR